MWKTRNIRRRNKGRKTKKQDGGLSLPFMGPSMDKIIEFAINNDMELTAQIEKKTGMLSKATMSDPFKIKFIKGKQIKFIQAEETKLDQIDPNVKPDTSYKYEMKGSNVEVILNLKTRIILIIDKTSISDINDKMKMKDASKAEKIKEMTEKTKVAEAEKKEESKYELHSKEIHSEMDLKINAETNEKGIDLLKLLQKLELLLGIIKERPTLTEPLAIVETPVVEEVKEQAGGADNALLDEIITKYPSLKGLKSIIDDLPEDIRQKYQSEINSTLEKVKESNVEEKVLMDEPEFQEIQSQFPPTTEETKIEETPKPDEETPIEEPIEEEKTDVETPTDEENPDVTPIEEEKTDVDTPTEEVKTDVMPPTVPTTTTTTVPTDTTPTVSTDTTTPTTTPTDTTTPTTTPTDTTTVSTDTTTPTVPTDTTTTPTTTTVPTDTTTTTTTTTVPTDTTSDTTTTTDTATTPSDEVKLKREDLKESPLLVQPTTGESGKYIFVPKDLVEKAIDFLLNNGCEVTTVNLK